MSGLQVPLFPKPAAPAQPQPHVTTHNSPGWNPAGNFRAAASWASGLEVRPPTLGITGLGISQGALALTRHHQAAWRS